MLSTERVAQQGSNHIPASSLAGERRYVVQTLARRESEERPQLGVQKFRSILPQITRRVLRARKPRAMRMVVFPGYLLVLLDPGRDRRRSIKGTFGAVGLVTGTELPRPVLHGIVRRLLDHAEGVGLCRLDRDLIEGQAVRVVASPFASEIGRLAWLDANGRLRMLLEIMGSDAPASLERSTLQAV